MTRNVQRCSACSLQGHNRACCPHVFTCKPPPRLHPHYTETHALREAVWEQLSFRFPKTPMELFSEIRDDWGAVEERRLWRALQWNLQRRRIEKKLAHREMP